MGEKDPCDSAVLESNRGETTETGEYDLAGDGERLERGLKSRHLQFLALGGAIGTGLFVGSGSILHDTGPAPLFMAYLVLSVVVWIIMSILAEMTVYLPLRGLTIPGFVDRFVDPSLGFACGWNYWYAYTMLVAAEASAAAIVIDYWKNSVNVAVWIAIILVVMLLLNILAASVFGESEFWFASIKLITLMGLIIVGIVILAGGAPNQKHALGFHYWNSPGAFNQYLGIPGPTGRFLGFWHASVKAGFAFITSPELICIAGGETVAPRRNIKKAASRFVWRLAFFYGLGSLVIGIMVPFDNLNLIGSSDASASPFVIGIQNVGIPVLNHIINAVILTSAWSAGNSFLYSGSRILYTLAITGQAPKFLALTNRGGVPYMAVLFTWTFTLLAFLNVSNSGAKVFNWFVNLSTISGFIAWIVIMVTYFRFRAAIRYNGLYESLPYKAVLQPYGTWFALLMITLLTLTNGFQVFVHNSFNASDFIAAYITLPIFLVLYFGHKIWKRTSWAIPLHEIDVVTGKKEMDELEAMDVPPVPKGVIQKIWYWLA
ncbi:putative proline-specific permease put4 [Escovopsis weberi]|uniref:Putative proline-specific permease put4 n=1 Tax=Escovopsis weberi TaxID=150374 RepID=A0A0M8N6S4_ESCWE|nr:putative proline-specific permease put4 [Escovopsis weberi]